MTTRICSFLLTTALLAIPLAAQNVETVTIESSELGQRREIVIYEPLGYSENEFAYYDVIYVFDAQLRGLVGYVSAIADLMDGPRGFIVVGIKATILEDEMYFRNHDLLPSDTEWNLGPKSGGNAEAFLAYVKNEVVPYVESEYRTLPLRTAVGHSLSASFLVYTLLEDPGLFDNYIAVSPNLAYDDERLVRGLRDFESDRLDRPMLFYMSHANEAESWSGWGPANDAAYAVLRDTLATEEFRVVLEEYPEHGHMSGFMPSVSSAMRTFIEDVRPAQVTELSPELFEITVTVTVPDEDDEIWISGNQETLGNWAPDQLKMERVSPLERRLTVSVQDWVEMKFYGGEGAAVQAWIATGEPESWGVPRTTWPMMLRPEQGAEYMFEVVGYQN